jgi:hypothetical protein
MGRMLTRRHSLLGTGAGSAQRDQFCGYRRGAQPSHRLPPTLYPEGWAIATRPGRLITRSLVSVREAEEGDKCPVEADQVVVWNAAEVLADVCARHRGDVVDHDLAVLFDTDSGGRLDIDAGQRGVDRLAAAPAVGGDRCNLRAWKRA